MVAVVDMWEFIELVSGSIGEVVKMKFNTASWMELSEWKLMELAIDRGIPS